MASTIVRARIDERVKKEAVATLAEFGLTLSDAVRLMLVRIARDKAMPFESLIPNATTIAAMAAAERGEFTGEFKTVDALMKHLHGAED